MNREPANKSMGFFAIYKEAYKLTASNKKIFSLIALTILLPLAFCFLSEIRILTYSNGWIAYGLIISQILFLILLFLFSLWSTSSVMYTIACFYTSRDITYKKVDGVLRKLWGRLSATFFWCSFTVAIYTSLTLEGISLIFISCLSIPAFAGLIYAMVVWNIATVVTVLEKDHDGRKALAKIYVNRISSVGKVFVGIGCHLLLAVWIHFLLFVHTVVYFVCKSVHDEDISTISTHLEVPVIHLGRGKEVPLEKVQVSV
ncbi:hypothetical protein MKX03_017736 [Papaver bracteatum]|nr:hypothetical protein MKX03_017736 [Papaver bracteatum]